MPGQLWPGIFNGSFLFKHDAFDAYGRAYCLRKVDVGNPGNSLGATPGYSLFWLLVLHLVKNELYLKKNYIP